jgi:hypothetical protein
MNKWMALSLSALSITGSMVVAGTSQEIPQSNLKVEATELVAGNFLIDSIVFKYWI